LEAFLDDVACRSRVEGNVVQLDEVMKSIISQYTTGMTIDLLSY
jgi:hypothetical protein